MARMPYEFISVAVTSQVSGLSYTISGRCGHHHYGAIKSPSVPSNQSSNSLAPFLAVKARTLTLRRWDACRPTVRIRLLRSE